MTHSLIVGGGLAGCLVARELANNGRQVTIIEKADDIGGKVRQYGCKAAEECSNCGVCLVGDLWDEVGSNDKINVITGAQIKDVLGSKGSYRVVVKTADGVKSLDGISDIVVSTGFEDFSTSFSGNLEIEEKDGLFSGWQLEKMFMERKKDGIFEEKPGSIAFIQCFGSRDAQQKAPYCSRVCCAYSTRMARAFRYFYPDAKITFFYMDLQKVQEGEYFNYLSNEKGIEFIRCRPVKIKGGKPATVEYEQPGEKGLKEREFDVIVLSEGIFSSADNAKMAELCMLGIDKDGFLKYVKDPGKTGIYLAGCAAGPKRIEEVYSESLGVARQIINN